MLRSSVLKRHLCSQCLHSSTRRFYSAQVAFAHSESSTSSVQQSNLHATDSSDSATPSTGKKEKEAGKGKGKGKTKAKKVPTPPPKNILEESKVEEYLAEIAATKNEATLEDLNRIRPERYPDPQSIEFEDAYNDLLDKLQQSFTKGQIVYFLRLHPDVPRPKRWTRPTKSAYAVQLIEHVWGWPSLTEVQKRRRDWSEVETEFFALNPSQSFLIMGKDGSELLSLSKEYNVHLSFSPKPLGLRVEGLRGALEKLREHVASFKEDLAEETLMIPIDKPVNPALLQRLSRISGAFAEKFSSKELRISYKKSNLRSLFVAKRLAIQACSVSAEDNPTPPIAYISPGVPRQTPIPMTMFPHSYAFYPFLSQRTIPWTSNDKAAFRLRKVGEWLGLDATEDIRKTGGLALGLGSTVTLDEKDVNLREKLSEDLSSRGEHSQIVTASLGHVLLTVPHASIVPPLKGSRPLGQILQWMNDEKAQHTFNTSLPSVLLDSPPTNKSILHRLVYRALQSSSDTSKVFKFEMLISLPKTQTTPATETENHSVQHERDENAEQKESDMHLQLEDSCVVGTEKVVDVMFPDRPMDISFSSFEYSAVSNKDYPEELRTYIDDITSFLRYTDPNAQQPDAPLLLHHNGEVFLLVSNTNVRQSHENISISSPTPMTLAATTEHQIDQEANQKSTVCHLTCDDIKSDEKWGSFLRQCDYLSAFLPKKESALTAAVSEGSDAFS